MNDGRDLEGELRSQLHLERQAYQPSTGFESRVRQAMRRASPAARSRASWRLQLAASAALLVFVGGLSAGAIWIRSTGVGKRVTPITTPAPTGVVEAVHFVSPARGWVVAGTMHADGTVSRRLLYTTDGGRQWTPQLTWSAQQRATAPGGSVRLLFVDAAHGFLQDLAGWGGQPLLYRTADAGRSWQSLRLPGLPAPGSALSFIDVLHGWLLADVNATMSQSTATIFRTADGGSTWVQVAHVDRTGGSPGLTMAGDKLSLTFADATTGWLVAQSSFGNAILWQTSDGGATWTQQTLPTPAGVYVNGTANPGAPQFFGSHEVVVPLQVALVPPPTGSPQTVPARGYPVVLYACLSNDGGRSWSFVVLPATGNMEQPLAWQFVDRQTWWVASGTDLYVTHDGGHSWAAHSLNLGASWALGFGFANQQSAWIIAGSWSAANGRSENAGLAQTSDDGLSWSVRKP